MATRTKVTRRVTNKRLEQLAAALDEVGRMKKFDFSDNIRRVLRLLELCPWIEGRPDDLPKKVAAKSKDNEGPQPRARQTA